MRCHTQEKLLKKSKLLYPFLDLDTDPAAKGPGSLDGPIMQVFNEMHCLPEETKNPLVSPVFAQDHELEGLPAAIIVLADNDNLRPEGQTYAHMLSQAGVSVAHTVSEGMPHGFFESGFGEISDAEMDFLGEDVRNNQFSFTNLANPSENPVRSIRSSFRSELRRQSKR